MLRKIIFLFVMMLFMASCNDKCEDVDAPSSPSLFVELLDEVTNENVFKDSIYLESHLLVRDSLELDIPHSLIFDSSILHIVLQDKIIENDTVFIKLNNIETLQKDSLKIIYSTIKVEGECYTQYKINTVAIPNLDYEIVDGIYKIKI